MSSAPSGKPRTQPYQKPARASEGTPTSGRLAISNLHYEVTEQDLIKIFKPFGTFARDPFIKYDKSGRSTGHAVVEYTTVGDATAAKTELDGANAKQQPITVRFDTAVRRRPHKEDNADKNASSSLVNRIAKTPLIHRLGNDQSMEVDPPAATSGPGPLRNRRSFGSQPHRGRGGRASKGRPKPKTADDLDKELEAFMQDKDAKPAEATGDDVSMAV